MRIEREESRIVFQGDLSYDQVHRGDRNSLVAEHPAQLTCPLKVLFSCFEVLNGTEEIIQRDLFFLRFCPSDKLRCDQTRVGRVAVSKKVFELIGYNFIGAPEKRNPDARIHKHLSSLMARLLPVTGKVELSFHPDDLLDFFPADILFHRGDDRCGFRSAAGYLHGFFDQIIGQIQGRFHDTSMNKYCMYDIA